MTKTEDHRETPLETRERVAKEQQELKEYNDKERALRESGLTHHVRALTELYVNECYHAAGDILDVSDLDYTPEKMEEVDPGIPISRQSSPRAPSRPIPESGGREAGVPSDDLEPGVDPEHREGGKRKR